MTTDIERILAIPSEATTDHPPTLAAEMTAALKTQDGTMELFDHQARALQYARDHGGSFHSHPVGTGKGLKHGTPVLTEGGWTPIERITTSHRVYGTDGSTHSVTGVFPQGLKQLYRLTFSDGRRIECDGDHLWTFRTPDRPRIFKTFDTATLHDMPLSRKAGKHRAWKLFLPDVAAVQTPDVELPLDPYTLGLRCTSHHKFIPSEYLAAGTQQRSELLSGLLDTDGTVDKAGAISFATVSRRLADDVAYLARSLGCRATVCEKHRKSGFSLNVNIKGPQGWNPLTCERHRQRVRRHQSGPCVSLRSVERIGEGETTCISVGSPDRLFLTKDFLPTHNTLVTYLLPAVCGYTRSLLLVPAHLREKTRREFEALAQHWDVSYPPIVRSYSELSIDRENLLLAALQPDAVIADECDALSNLRAGCTRKVLRWFVQNPQCRFHALTGTPIRRSLMDVAHLAAVALRKGSPLPLARPVQRLWAAAVDPDLTNGKAGCDFSSAKRARLHLLKPACPDYGDHWPREVVAHRLRTCPGWSWADKSFDGPLTFSTRKVSMSPAAADVLEEMRRTWMTPEGEIIDAAVEMWRHASELAHGYYGVWDPPPPQDWARPRSAWASWVRSRLQLGGHWDTPMALANALDSGELQDKEGARLLADWRAVRDSYEPNPVPRWVDKSAPLLLDAAQWLQEHPHGLVWTAHQPVAERLAELANVPAFGAGQGQGNRPQIEDHDGPAILTIGANKTGRNLQKWRDNYMLSVPAGAYLVDQIVGRTHRYGQKHPVTVTFADVVPEQREALRKAVLLAKFTHETEGYRPKILDWVE